MSAAGRPGRVVDRARKVIALVLRRMALWQRVKTSTSRADEILDRRREILRAEARVIRRRP